MSSKNKVIKGEKAAKTPAGQSKTGALQSQTNERHKHGGIAILALLILLIATFIFSLCLGRYQFSPSDIIQVLWGTLTQSNVDPMASNIVFSVRMPRILMGILVGAALAEAGATYQAVFGNPLVSSDILGVSSGASFGATLGILLSVGTIGIQAWSLAFGLIALVIVIFLGRVQKKTQLYMLVLAGVIVSSLFSALVSLLEYVADPYDQLPAIVTWLMGSLTSSSYGDVVTSAIIILPCCILLWLLRWKLNLLSLDEEEAASLGIDVSKMRILVLVIATLMTAVTVSLCGVIGWIGLVIPHMCRMIVGNDHRVLIPSSMLMGGAYLLLIDDIARCATGTEIPLSILTAIIGAPVFMSLLQKTGGSAK